MTNSVIIAIAFLFHPSIKVWFSSNIFDRPFFKVSIEPSILVVKIPIRVLNINTPTKVINNKINKNAHLPASPPITPGSNIRVNDIQNILRKDKFPPSTVILTNMDVMIININFYGYTLFIKTFY